MPDASDEKFGPEGDRTIWHYTKGDALLGILTQRCLWASSILYLNDSAEFYHVRELMSEWMDKTGNGSGSGKEPVFVQILKRQLGRSDALNTFVISFSELCDDLSQWRAYGAGGGYCLGFAPSLLRSIAESQGFALVKCIYDHDLKIQLVGELVKEHLTRFREVEADITDDDLGAGLGLYSDLDPSPTLRALSKDFFLQAQELASRIKSEAFESEREWRLVSVQPPEPEALRFRSRPSMLIPYRLFQLTRGDENPSLRHIVVGPSPHIQLNLTALAALSRTHKVALRAVSESRVPYRDW